jgi:hypothetical protein
VLGVLRSHPGPPVTGILSGPRLPHSQLTKPLLLYSAMITTLLSCIYTKFRAWGSVETDISARFGRGFHACAVLRSQGRGGGLFWPSAAAFTADQTLASVFSAICFMQRDGVNENVVGCSFVFGRRRLYSR